VLFDLFAQWDVWVTLAGLFSGVVVGLTGLGGAAIVTPMLVLLFGVPAPIAVSTDLVSAAIIKPIGATVHVRRRTPHIAVVAWLSAGSVPGVLLGTWVFTLLSPAAVKQMIGGVLLTAIVVTVARARAARKIPALHSDHLSTSTAKNLLTLLIGLTVGFLVGMTSVGSGTLIAAALLILYPTMRPNRLVGTDLLQAVPMLLVGAVAHWGLGAVSWPIVISLLLGQMPGVYLGARVSSRYHGSELRWLLLVIIGGGGIALLGAPAWVAAVITVTGTFALGIPIMLNHWRTRGSAADGTPAIAHDPSGGRVPNSLSRSDRGQQLVTEDSRAG
jgi:uncharacterized membrane protein YfcA